MENFRINKFFKCICSLSGQLVLNTSGRMSRVPGNVPLLAFILLSMIFPLQAGVQIPQAVRAAVQQKSSDHRRYFFILVMKVPYSQKTPTRSVMAVTKKVPVPNNV
jgi:hypothetical protein